MDVISDTIFEIFCAIVLMAAITIMLTLNNAGSKTTKAIDDNVRSKTTITEGVSTVNKETITGSSVYYNICQFAKNGTTTKIFLTSTDSTDKIAVQESWLQSIRINDFSQQLSNNIQYDKEYKVIYNTDEEGNIKSVTYELQN